MRKVKTRIKTDRFHGDGREGGSLLYVIFFITQLSVFACGFMAVSRYHIKMALKNRAYMEARLTTHMIHNSFCEAVSKGESDALRLLWNQYEGDLEDEEAEENENEDMPGFVREYAERIRKSNETQGKNGIFFGHGTREIATVRAILLEKEFVCDSEVIDVLISTVADTLLISKESIATKLDAIALLICIVVKYPEDYIRNQNVYEKLFEQQKAIEVEDHSIISSNIDNISLKIGLQFLFTIMEKDVYNDILELMPYIQGDIPTTISVTNLIVEYLENSDDVVLPQRVESIILQNVLQWLQSEHIDIRWNATRILLAMSRNPENDGVVNHQLVNLIDSNSAYIKNLIMRQLHKMRGITDKTREHIISKCKHDANFVVRMVCDEVEKDVAEE